MNLKEKRLITSLNAKEFTQLCIKFNACQEGINWIEGKSFNEFLDSCYRGDWFLWLFKRVAPDKLQMLTLAKGHCANTVRHLMKDERSTKAVDAAIAFGEGKITREELNDAYAAAAAAYATAAAAYAAAAAAADAADAAAYACADADAAAAYAAAYAAYAAAAAAAYAAYARQKNSLLTANLCRKYLQFSQIEVEL